MNKSAIAMIAGLVSIAAVQQADAVAVTVGTADPSNGNCYPFMCNDSGTSSGPSINYEQVYTSAAFGAPTSIGSATFYFAPQFGGNDTLLGGTYNFYLSTTSAAVGGLGSSMSGNLGPDNTEVLSVTIPAGGTSFGSSYLFNFTTPFNYNPGSGNLLLDVIVTNQDNVPNGAGNGYNAMVDTAGVTSRDYSFNGSDSGNPDSAEGLLTTFNAAPTSVPEPATLLIFGAGLACFGAARRRKHEKG